MSSASALSTPLPQLDQLTGFNSKRPRYALGDVELDA
jgi:hypothetical protein